MRFLKFPNWKEWRAYCTNLVFPPQCVYCNRPLPETQVLDPMRIGLHLCGPCSRRVLFQGSAFCPKCGLFSPVSESGDSSSVSSCFDCEEISRAYDQVIPLGKYRDELREAVLRMKRDRMGLLAESFAALLYLERKAELHRFDPDWIVPVPMHFTRRWIRGVNSPDFSADFLGRKMGVPVLKHLLFRNRATLPQSDLQLEERAKNIRGAFKLRGRFFPRMFRKNERLRIGEKRVLLVDDILTTGSTANEIALLLKHYGAKSVAVCVFAKSPYAPGVVKF